MNITDIRVRKLDRDGIKLKAVASVTLDNAIVVHDVKIIQGENGLFIAMPSRKLDDGTYKDIAHPINAEARAELQKAVLEAYENAESEAL